MLLNPLHRLIVRAADAPVVDLTGKRIIVTGAAVGSIGGETARILTAWGADVITTNRSGNGVSHALDLGDANSVRTFAAWVREETDDHVDVLVNNAAILLDLMRSWKEPRLLDGFESMWRVNFLGTMHLTTLLLPALSGGRVVNVVSTSHKRATNASLFDDWTYNSYKAYGRSKLALMHLTAELDRRHPDVEAVTVHPGEVYTGIATAALAEHKAVLAARNALRPLEQFITMTATEGAQTQVMLASAPTVQRGAYYVRCKPATASAELKDRAVSARLWDQTQEWLQHQAGSAA